MSSTQSTLVKWPALLVNFLFIIPIYLRPICCAEPRAETFDMHELTHDIPPIKPQNQVEFVVERNENLQYNVQPPEPSNTLQLFLSKPLKVREMEYKFLHDGVPNWALVDIHEGNEPFIKWPRVNAKHRGNYSLYRFEYDVHQRLVTSSRTDFRLDVTNLSGHGQKCDDDGDCASNKCHFHLCACSDNMHVVGRMRQCVRAKNINETCQHDVECQLMAGPSAECFQAWGKCRCNINSVPIKISSAFRHCISLAQLHSQCLYSMECSLVGDNRYCNSNYRCACLPGYRLEHDRHCTSASGSLKALVLHVFSGILAFIILCL